MSLRKWTSSSFVVRDIGELLAPAATDYPTRGKTGQVPYRRFKPKMSAFGSLCGERRQVRLGSCKHPVAQSFPFRPIRQTAKNVPRATVATAAAREYRALLY